MIIGDLILNKKGKPDIRQNCLIKCDECSKEYQRRYDVVCNSRSNWDNKDLCKSCSTKKSLELGIRKTFSEYNKQQKQQNIL